MLMQIVTSPSPAPQTLLHQLTGEVMQSFAKQHTPQHLKHVDSQGDS